MLVASYVFYGWWDWRFVFLLAGVDGRQPGVRRRASTARGAAAQRKALLVARAGRQPRRARLLQVLRLLRHARRRTAARLGLDVSARCSQVDRCRSASRSSRSRRSATSIDVYRGDFEPVDARRTSPSTCRSSRTSWPARSCARASSCRSSRARATRGASTRASPFFLIVGGLFKKVVIANYLADAIVDASSPRPEQHRRSRCWSRSTPTPSRSTPTSRLHRHRDRLALLLGFRFPQNFDAPVRARVAAGLLAPLAHDAVALAARLPLHPARRQPRQRGSSRTAT